MEILFFVSLATVPAMTSLLLAARLWGKDRVMRFVREMAFNVNWLLSGFAARLLRAARALIAVEIDRDDLKDEFVAEIEEIIAHRMGRELGNLNARLYDLDRRLQALAPVTDEDRY